MYRSEYGTRPDQLCDAGTPIKKLPIINGKWLVFRKSAQIRKEGLDYIAGQSEMTIIFNLMILNRIRTFFN